MLLTAWRDLQFRRRRVAIAVIGTALVLALSLVMTGISASFRNEVRNSLRSFEAQSWLRPATANGVLIASSPFEVAKAPTAAQLGVKRADPVLFRNTSVGRGPKDQIAYFGVVRGGLGDPKPSSGERLAKDGDIVLDAKLGRKVGESISVGGNPFTIVGLVKHRSILAGVPLAYMSLADGQKLAFGGRPLANTIALSETPTAAPAGWTTNTEAEAETEMLQPLLQAMKTIDLVKGLLWLVAALILGSVMYLQSLERSRDFAVLKATGSSAASIGGSLALQAVFLTLVASALGIVIGALLAPLFPMNVEIPPVSFAALPLIALVIGLLASITGLRRSLKIEPAFAFRGA
jgi:putative ABC transport system permease protein